jgi:3-oxoacyl-[acyl-carrier protein] reductase
VIGTATTAEGAARISEALAGARRPRRGARRGHESGIHRRAARRHRGKEGAVGILCNNAGITRDMLLLRMKQRIGMR